MATAGAIANTTVATVTTAAVIAIVEFIQVNYSLMVLNVQKIAFTCFVVVEQLEFSFSKNWVILYFLIAAINF